MLGQHFRDLVNAYINSFPKASIGHDLASFSPVPNIGKENKFEYFYHPYNYLCNTAKFITYGDEVVPSARDPNFLYQELLNYRDFIDEFLASHGKTRRRIDP